MGINTKYWSRFNKHGSSEELIKLGRYCSIMVTLKLRYVGIIISDESSALSSEWWNSQYTRKREAATSASKLLPTYHTPSQECNSNCFFCTSHISTETLPSFTLHKLVASLTNNSYKKKTRRKLFLHRDMFSFFDIVTI